MCCGDDQGHVSRFKKSSKLTRRRLLELAAKGAASAAFLNISEGRTALSAPDVSNTGNLHLLFGPVENFTTDIHQAPSHLVIPLGARVVFSVIGTNDEIAWKGYPPVSIVGEREAVFEFMQPGEVSIYAYSRSLSATGQNDFAACRITVAELAPSDLAFAYDADCHEKIVITEDATNDETVKAYFSGGTLVAPIWDNGALVVPLASNLVCRPYPKAPRHLSKSALAGLIEWRVEDRAIGVGELKNLTTAVWPGNHRVAVGPPATEKSFDLSVYDTEILSEYTDTEKAMPEGVPVEFEARTNPPGFEEHVQWLAATKYGSAEPTLGKGKKFTTTFLNTFGPRDGGISQWIGVRANNVRLGQDGKSCGGCSEWKFLATGVWTGPDTLEVSGGQIMEFCLQNLNILGTTITIETKTGQSSSTVLAPLGTAKIRFSVLACEPTPWTFHISTTADAFSVAWTLCGSWAPGDPPNC